MGTSQALPGPTANSCLLASHWTLRLASKTVASERWRASAGIPASRSPFRPRSTDWPRHWPGWTLSPVTRRALGLGVRNSLGTAPRRIAADIPTEVIWAHDHLGRYGGVGVGHEDSLGPVGHVQPSGDTSSEISPRQRPYSRQTCLGELRKLQTCALCACNGIMAIMQIPSAPVAIMMAVERLAEIFDIPALTQDIRGGAFTDDKLFRPTIVNIRGQSFALEWRRSGSIGQVLRSIHQLKMVHGGYPRGVLSLLIVPYMGKAAQESCARSKQCWLDLSGNARIVTPDTFYQNLGNPNRFRRPGRPESAFGPRGSRIARRLLMQPSKAIRQRALASSSGLDEGHTSRIVAKLLETGLVERGEDGISVADPQALLDAWREDYRFDRHHVISGHISEGGGGLLIRALAEGLAKAEEPYATTALPAAWLWTHHARSSLTTVYISTLPSAGLKRDLGFREEARGGNTWLVVPNDEDVFHGAELVDGIRCVHPIQAYLDLKDHPERATEAAAELRRLLGWQDRNDTSPWFGEPYPPGGSHR